MFPSTIEIFFDKILLLIGRSYLCNITKLIQFNQLSLTLTKLCLIFTANGQRLKHDPYPVYLGITLDRTLSYREHLSRSAAKLKSRNNLIAKLAGTSWGASASTASAHQPWLYATQSQITAVLCSLDPATQSSSTPKGYSSFIQYGLNQYQ